MPPDNIQPPQRPRRNQNHTRPLSPSAAAMFKNRHIQPQQVMPWVVQLRVVGTSDLINATIDDENLTLGRRVDGAPGPVSIDLTPYRAFEQGVSRVHAALRATAEGLCIVDMQSSNGTLLNGERLQPYQPIFIKDGDTLTLGHMQVQVRLSVVPTHIDPEVKQAVGAGKSLLIVEDDNDVAEAYRAVFEFFGFAVTHTDDPAGALRHLAQATPDLVISDLILTGQPSSVDIVHLLQAELKGKAPILVVSGLTGGHRQRQALASGAVAFMGKPVRTDQLVARVTALLNNWEQRT